MILCIFWQMVFAILEMHAMTNGDVLQEKGVKSQNPSFKIFLTAVLSRELQNDERQSHGGRNSQIAFGNGINGINYGFFGSFNYYFLHPHKKHPGISHPHPPTTASGCPAIVTPDMCLPNTGVCGSNTTCSVNEICCKGSEMAFSCCVQLGATPPTSQYTTTTKQPITTKPTTTGYPSTTPQTYPWTATTGLVGYCPYYITSSMCMGDGYYCSSSAECFPDEFCCRTPHVLPGCCYKYPTATSTPQPATTTLVATSPPFLKRNLIAGIAVLRRELPNDERQSHGGRNSQIASGNGINGINYGFFGSFNYDFQHPHKKHHPHPPTTAPSTTTRQPTTDGCPAIVTPTMCKSTGVCGYNNMCGVNEICCKGSEMAFSCCVQLGATPPTSQYTTITEPTHDYQSTTTEMWATTTGFVGDCPYYISSSMCMGNGYYCSSSAECFSNEFCCKTYDLRGCCYKYPTPTTKPTAEETTTTSTAYDTTPGLTYCPYYIQESNCTYDTYPCGYYEKCYGNYKCCRYSYQNPTCCIYDSSSTSTDTPATATSLLPCNIPPGISYVYYGSSCNSCYLYTDSSCCNWSYGPGCYSWVIPTSATEN